MPGNKIYVFCSCYHDLQLMRLYDRTDIIACGDYIAVTEIAACTGCGVFIDRCPLDARTWNKEKMDFNPKVCYGCDLCVNICLEKSTGLTRNFNKEKMI